MSEKLLPGTAGYSNNPILLLKERLPDGTKLSPAGYTGKCWQIRCFFAMVNTLNTLSLTL
jgi:hypothetical protein